MKPTITSTAAGVAVFSGLAAIVAADALPNDSIPLQCIKVCGPIVELTSICNTNVDARRRAVRRRRVDEVTAGARGPRLHYGRMKEKECKGGRCITEKMAVDAEKREFSVIRQAPTSFPPDLVDLPEETGAATTQPQPTRIFPSIVTTSTVPTAATTAPPPTGNTDGDADGDGGNDGDDDGDDVPSTSTTASTSRRRSATSTAAPSATSTGPAAVADADGEESWWTPDDAEQQCVCSNKSFDVGRLTALCASCIDQTGDPTNNINIIISTCKFKSETYSPSLDSVADNVRVKATKPTLQMTSGAGTNAAMAQMVKGSSNVNVQSRAAVALAAGVAVWAVMMLM